MALISPLQELISRRRQSSEEDDAIDGGRIAQWDAFDQEAARHVDRLRADGRDGGLEQVSASPDLYPLPLLDPRDW